MTEPPSQPVVAAVLQRIRAGWLPHRVGPEPGSWWWGRPWRDDGFRLWTAGMVPSMRVVDHMTTDEINLWVGSLHPYAPEAAPSPSAGLTRTPEQ